VGVWSTFWFNWQRHSPDLEALRAFTVENLLYISLFKEF
jgi:hypothetical protein